MPSTSCCVWPRRLEQRDGDRGPAAAGTGPVTATPVVIPSRSTPFFSVVSAVLVVYFAVKALVLGDGPAVFSLLLGATTAVVGLWWLWRAGQRTVVLDGDRLIIRNGRQARVYSRAEIVSIDLSSLDRQIVFADGSGIRLPLEGHELVKAGFLLTPPRRYRAV